MIKRAFAVFLFCFFVSLAVIAQERSRVHNDDSVALSSIFENVQSSIVNDRVQSISVNFSGQVYISLQGTDGGYYSANQGAIILQNFFDSHRVIHFRLSTINSTQDLPYATGAGTFIYRGKRESLQIYVGLTKSNSRWVISQFNIY